MAADENFDNDILRGLLRRAPHFNILRVQDFQQTSGQPDSVVLAWATENDRVLLTHDLSTMVSALEERLSASGRCSQIVFISDSLPVRSVIDDILLLDECGDESDWASGVIYLPLK